jgi:hypothetical protein
MVVALSAGNDPEYVVVAETLRVGTRPPSVSRAAASTKGEFRSASAVREARGAAKESEIAHWT